MKRDTFHIYAEAKKKRSLIHFRMAGMRTRNILLSCFNQPKAEVPYHNQHYYEHNDYTTEVE